MKKFFLVFITCFIVLFSVSPLCFAYSASTYADLAQSSTQANNLISYAENYKSFQNSDFVVSQVGQYEYRIFWGDLKYNGLSVSGNEIEYLQYVREGSGYDYTYHYNYGNESTLSLSIDNLVVSNIPELGSSSVLFEQFNFYDDFVYFTVFVVCLLLVVAILSFRSCYK